MQGYMSKQLKKHAPVPEYVSPKQYTIEGFGNPFSQHLDKKNRWVVLAGLIPWDELCSVYYKHVGTSATGRKPLNPRMVIASLIIKHLCNLDDRETVLQISENMYMQYFLGFSSFTPQKPFDPSLFVEFRKRLGLDAVNAINGRIIEIKTRFESTENPPAPDSPPGQDGDPPSGGPGSSGTPGNKGRLITDATACPQDIAFPTDLDLLSDAREKSEELIDKLYQKGLHGQKPRTYREIARKLYLSTAQKRNKSKKEIRKGTGRQLRFLGRNIKHIDTLLDAYGTGIPLNSTDYRYMLVIRTLYLQQEEMFSNSTHSVEHRIVSIHQPHVRPIVRGKSNAKVEFGAKINVSVIDGISFLDELSWDAFNEGSHLQGYIEQYKKRFGFYPRELLADKIYCTRENRRVLKERGIKLIAKPLGRPSAVTEHVSPGERNPIEGKFGQAKTGYGLGRIKARLKGTSESWIATIILVLNLVKLAGAIPYSLFSAFLCFFDDAISGRWCGSKPQRFVLGCSWNV